MIHELDVLRVLVLTTLVVAPLATRPYVGHGRLLVVAHAAAFVVTAVGLVSAIHELSVAWLLFRAGDFAVFLWSRRRAPWTLGTLVPSVPYLFSNIAAVWIVAGSNDLRLLGYGPDFSYYAALHGNVVGVMLMGSLALLAREPAPSRGIYVIALFTCVASFLLIAFGIDRLHTLKPIGVIGLTVALAVAQLVFLRQAWSHHRPAFALGALSVAALVVTMSLAWRNEFVTPIFIGVAGVRGMVSVHGVINALVVGPFFLLAVWLDMRGDASRRSRV